jgi:hypothetical protein
MIGTLSLQFEQRSVIGREGSGFSGNNRLSVAMLLPTGQLEDAFKNGIRGQPNREAPPKKTLQIQRTTPTTKQQTKKHSQ